MNPSSAAPRGTPILVWDLPVRVFHWLMVLSFVGAWLSSGSERWQLVHITLGYTMAALVVLRVVWGLVGSRHARFTAFVRGPRALAAYIASMRRHPPEHFTGHNPAGALAIVALLVLTLVTVGFGWASYSERGGDWLAEVHEGASNVLLGVVGLHLAGVVVGSWLHGENLVRAMFTGRKLGRPDESIGRTRRSLGVLLLAAVLGFWLFQWATSPGPVVPPGNAATPRASDD